MSSHMAPPTLASIGTVLIDIFESPPTASDSPLAPPRPRRFDSNSSASPQSEPPEEFAPDGRVAIGGGAVYALVGARVWLPSSELRTVTDRAPDGEADEDLPQHLEEELNRFGQDIWVFSRAPGHRVPRARIGYLGDTRTYVHVIKPPLRCGTDIASGPLARAKWLHVPPPYTSSDLLRLVDELEAASDWRPRIAFEPAPASCISEEKHNFELACRRVDIISPNHEELFAFYDMPKRHTESPESTKLAVEALVAHLLVIGVGREGEGIVAIRCSWMGCCVGTRSGGIKWLPSYMKEKERVVDVTGAGNAFIGGYIAGLQLSGGDAYEAALHATVSASFMIEQVGLPQLERRINAEGSSVELWNAELPVDRVEVLRARAYDEGYWLRPE